MKKKENVKNKINNKMKDSHRKMYGRLQQKQEQVDENAEKERLKNHSYQIGNISIVDISPHNNCCVE